MTTDKLSVAIIFKNEARCLERCMKSLQPLRKRVPMEIVMADTGSDDGSRKIAEQYADVVFDFPWVNDFSAARNAVLDRCTGAWALVMDCDEWLGGDVDELVTFLRGSRKNKFDEVMLTIRNYLTPELSEYDRSEAFRLLNLASKPRYAGAIHEITEFPGKAREAKLNRTFLHHDGYVMLNDGSEAGREKIGRNIALLRAELEKTPDDLHRLLQFAESGGLEPDWAEKLRHGVSLVEAKASEWDVYGAPLLSYGAGMAHQNGLPEAEAWARKALGLFPDSYFTRIDTAYVLAVLSFERQDFAAAAEHGEAYLRAVRGYAEDGGSRAATAMSTLRRNNSRSERDIRVVLARSYVCLGQARKALPMLKDWAWEETDARQVKNFLVACHELAAQSGMGEVAPLLMECREGIQKPLPTAQRARERLEAFRALCTIGDEAPRQEAPRELLELAERVRAILAKYPADDPAVIDLKSSAAYQKVKNLIER